jgi:predicted nucleic acid-binding protein
VSVFVDTSALLAVLDRSDEHHGEADRRWQGLLAGDEPLATTSYVLVEAFALVQARLGIKAARALAVDIGPVLTIRSVDAAAHGAGVAAMLGAGRRRLSLVDCVSFEVMKELGIRRSFDFDSHFREQGFERA